MTKGKYEDKYKWQQYIPAMFLWPAMGFVVYMLWNKRCDYEHFVRNDKIEIAVTKIKYQGIFSMVNSKYIFSGHNGDRIDFREGDIIRKDSLDSVIRVFRSDDTIELKSYDFEGMDLFMRKQCD